MAGGYFDLIARLEQNSRIGGGRIALIFGSARVSFGELARRSVSVSRALASAGVGPGDRIGHVAADSPALYELLYGCARLGAVLVPVNWRLAADEVDYIVDHAGARVLITDRTDLTAETVINVENFAAWRDRAPAVELPEIVVDRDTPIVQMYTSGTTGRPKGVVLGQRTFTAVRELLDDAGLDWIDWRDGDVSLIALPGFHIGGMWWATQALNKGIPSVVIPRFKALDAVTAIRENGVTVSCFVPAMLLMMLSEPGLTKSDFATIRKIAYGGSPIGPDLLSQALDTFGCDFAQIYGLTETGNTAVCLPPSEHLPGRARLHAAGRPYPGVGVAIRGPDGTELPPGRCGEVYLRSPAQMLEYFDNPAATRQTIVDGWIRTGDAGYLDDDGFLVIRDRVKDLIIVTGENVYPAEVEKTINAHPAVHDSAVVGAPDFLRGESIHAFVVAKQDEVLQLDDLERFLARRLARFKVPGTFHVTDAIPRNPSGKILRRTLREQFWAGLERQIN
ncbi:MAG: AMP-binding protein [Actinomycetota bacterium]|uniref:AMP-binding protein n=1 Tax=Mycobacterium lentiflavum TaxID=141349 RepID=A0ABY3UMJ4_MYCLN|nr:AMP-binding protein [Mycobacterium lentiflavum]MEE3062911.1 AMP-binding protein [Actinomycetota bacterium]ULP40824.1 AMP-binding protein [Mycobacterium lentiflavum]